MSLLLPVELWLDIFRWATTTPMTQALSATNYLPFQPICVDFVDKEAISVKRALVLVCKQWRQWAFDLLLEDVIIQRGIDILKHMLQGERDKTLGYARVRRACLPYCNSIPFNTESEVATSVIKSCSRLEVLVRPSPCNSSDLSFDLPIDDCPPLPALKRLDWWYYNEAIRTGGLNSLTDVLRAAPHLQYLSVGGNLGLSVMQRTPVRLPALTTLRLRRINVLVLAQISRWALPSLKHIILDTFDNRLAVSDFWSIFGPQIKTIELAQNPRSLVDGQSDILSSCPDLDELSFFIHFTAIPIYGPDFQHNLTTVRFYAQRSTCCGEESETYWSQIEGHFAAFSNTDHFPKLARVVLHGDWSPVLSSEHFRKLSSRISERGCTIEMAQC